MDGHSPRLMLAMAPNPFCDPQQIGVKSAARHRP